MRTRRQFLAASAATFAASTLPRSLRAERRGGDVFANANLGAAAQGLLNIETFQNLQGDVFTLFAENDGVAYLRLLRVLDWNTATLADLERPVLPTPGSYLPPARKVETRTRTRKGIQLDQFTLNFQSSGDPFTQDSYIVDHGRLGRFVLFVVPSSPEVCHATFCTFPNPAIPKVVLAALPPRR